MNLSLRTLGRKKCEDPSIDILNVLKEYINNPNLQIKTFVNGSFYSLLSKTNLKKRAKAIELDKLFLSIIKDSDELFQKQIKYILDQLNKEEDEEDLLSDSEKDENDVDEIDDDHEVP